MQVTKEQIDPCKVALTITFEPEVVNAAREKAFAQAVRTIQIPGFRKGKVPPPMARQYVDQNQVKQHAAEQLIEANYEQALQDGEVQPFAQPEMEMVEMTDGGPLVVRATVPLAPVVTLGLYKSLTIERRRPEVSETDLDRQVEEMRTRKAEFPEIEDRPVKMDDLLLGDLKVAVLDADDTAEDISEQRQAVIQVGKNIPDFDAGLVGMNLRETKEIETIYPDDHSDERLRGKRVRFTVTLLEIHERILPELNDEFVAANHPTAKTVTELRTALHENLEKAADRMADNDLEARMVAQVVQTSQIYYPELLLRAELESDARNIREYIEENNLTPEAYLEQVGQSEEEFNNRMAQAADIRIRNSLALSQIAQSEKIEVTDADLDVQINRRAERQNVSPAAVRAYAEKNGQIESMRNVAMTEKILAFLKEHSTITDRVLTREEIAAESGETDEDIYEDLVEEAEAIEDEEGDEGIALPMGSAPVKRRSGSEE